VPVSKKERPFGPVDLLARSREWFSQTKRAWRGRLRRP